MAYDLIFLGPVGMSLHDGDPASIGFPISPLEGSFSVLLQGNQNGAGIPDPVFLEQGGDVTAPEIRLLASGELDTLGVSLDGTAIPMTQIGTVGGAPLLSGDVSVFSGTTAELRISSGTMLPGATFLVVDAIRFVPEPSTALLLATGLVGLAVRRRQR